MLLVVYIIVNNILKVTAGFNLYYLYNLSAQFYSTFWKSHGESICFFQILRKNYFLFLLSKITNPRVFSRDACSRVQPSAAECCKPRTLTVNQFVTQLPSIQSSVLEQSACPALTLLHSHYILSPFGSIWYHLGKLFICISD